MGRDVTGFTSIEIERERLINFLSSTPKGICSATKETVRAIMLKTDGRLLIASSQFDIIAKQLGGGVYRLTLKEVL